MFKDNKLLITGGTGSFGSAVLNRFLHTDHFKEIRIFSRDEKKQDDMRTRYKNDKIKFYIGDVRDPMSIEPAVKGVDYIFHAAALKQVPSCEFFPLEATKTNVFGTSNVIEAAGRNGIKKVICLSTDKAAYPINAMGITKALMEKVAIAASRNLTGTTVCLTRYGNVMASRGSVIPLFINQIQSGQPLTITDPKMKVLIAGDGADKLVAEQTVIEYGLSEYISFLGWIHGEKKKELIRHSDVFILPSYFEGFPNSVLEAMASGLPVIVTDVGAVSELVDENNGIIVPIGDVDKITNSMSIYYTNGQLRKAHGMNGYLKVKSTFDIESAVKKFEKILI